MIKAPPAHSYSRLHTYSACPLQYKLQYLDKLPAPPADPLQLGGALHDYFEAYGKHCQAMKIETDLSMVNKIRKNILHTLKQPLPDHLVDQYNEMAQKFAEMETLDANILVGIELDIAFTGDWKKCGWMDKKVAFRLKMDRLYKDGDQAIIRDYKTGYGEGNPFQMRVYAAGVFTLMPEVLKCETEFSYVGSAHLAKRAFDRAELPALVEEIEEKCARVAEDKVFKPTPGSACQYCAYVGMCTAKPSNLLIITKPADAKQIAEDLFVLEAHVKAKKDALKGYVEGHGDVETSSGRWGFNKTETIAVRDMAALMSVLELKGIDPMRCLSITGTALKGLYKKNEGLKEDIEPLLDVKVSETFKGMELKKDEVKS